MDMMVKKLWCGNCSGDQKMTIGLLESYTLLHNKYKKLRCTCHKCGKTDERRMKEEHYERLQAQKDEVRQRDLFSDDEQPTDVINF